MVFASDGWSSTTALTSGLFVGFCALPKTLYQFSYPIGIFETMMWNDYTNKIK